ncbi:MAG: kumamolisin, partial [Frankiaceae bacterium]|nr:kumamolisin [Frankiaceae bacterium]
LSAAARHARIVALAPGSSRHADVARRVAAFGLRVTSEDTWSETVTGPASVIRAAFGSASAPRRPATLATSAVAVLPSSGRVAYPLASSKPKATTGTDLRTAYAAPSGTTLGQGLTIATVQLSGWNSDDLTTYGGTLSPPVTPTYTAVSVNHANPNKADGDGGDAEVALDQETLLAVAPSAAQRAYFASNSDGGAGFIKAVQLTAGDASAQHIAALSISWGACETAAGSQFMAAMDQALQLAVAAGITVFAASGDDGSRDCIGSTGSAAAAVDYPASSPYVVGVGGTTLPKPPSTPSAWSGSGGGESSRTALPSWQQSVRSKSPHGRRLVPDIASDGSPANGIAVLDSVPSDQSQWWNVIGGTSFGAPTQAAMLADSLATAGWPDGGIGDIHPALYAAGAASSTAFTDITTGGNGAYAAGPGFDLVTGLGAPRWSTIASWLGGFTLTAPAGTKSTTVPLTVGMPPGLPGSYRSWSAAAVNAAASCDTATAASPPTSADLGAGAADGIYSISVAGIDGSAANGGTGACHVMSTSVVLDRVAPVAIASVRPVTSTTAIASWGSSDTAPSSGTSTYTVTIVDGGGTLYSATTTATSVTFAASAYRSYNINVVASDAAGNRSATATAHLYDDLSLGFGTDWKTIASSGYYRSSRHVTSMQNAAATVSGTGSLFVVYVTTCASCGKLAIYNGNTLLRVVSLTTNRIHTLVPVTLLSASTRAKRTLSLRAAHASATATSVQLDAAVIR